MAFSFWPVFRTTRRYGLQAPVYAANAWAIIVQSVNRRCPASATNEALACVEQARFFYRTATESPEWAAKPLPLYYSLLNLAKALALTNAVRPTFDKARHGIVERLGPGAKELLDAYVECRRARAGDPPSVFEDLMVALGSTPLPDRARLSLPALLPQILPGHRFWCQATDSNERFVPLVAVPIMHEALSKSIWAVMEISSEDLARADLSRTQLLNRSRAGALFRDVKWPEGVGDGVYLEQILITSYAGRPSDNVSDLIKLLRPYIWATATAVPPYRKYYLYAAPTAEHGEVVPQLVSVYALVFYLGSITRYRPQQFEGILRSPFGGHIQEILTTQPGQFLYLVASEFAQRDVVRAPLV